MNRLMTIMAVMLTSLCASTAIAQNYYVDAENPEMLRFGDVEERKEREYKESEDTQMMLDTKTEQK